MSRLSWAVLTLSALAGAAVWGVADPEASQAERLRTAKALFFDRQYAEARQAWGQVLSGSSGAQADAAAYWIARCSESLGEHERALREYGEFLARPPAEATLAEEARTSRLGLAARLVKQGRREYHSLLQEGLADASKSVRYFAALQLASLGKPEAEAAIPLLRSIVAREKDEDLVERAKLALFKLDPQSLSDSPARPGGRRAPVAARWLHVRIYEGGRSRPKVTINVPLALAEVFFKSLPDEARQELQRKGYDPANFLDRLRSLGPGQILDIEGDEKERIQIWLQ